MQHPNMVDLEYHHIIHHTYLEHKFNLKKKNMTTPSKGIFEAIYISLHIKWCPGWDTKIMVKIKEFI